MKESVFACSGSQPRTLPERTPKIKLIFLDFDGVLINRASFTERLRVPGWQGAAAHPKCMEQLNRIVAETGAKVVVSSVHRMGGKTINMREKLRAWGFKGDCVGITPVLRRKGTDHIVIAEPRGIEIQAWIDEHEGTRYEPHSFCVIDDDADMEHLLPLLVQTKFEDGLTAANADHAIALLNHGRAV